MFDCFVEDEYDYIYSIVEGFVNIVSDSPDEINDSLDKRIISDVNLSKSNTLLVPNIRIHTTKGNVDMYYFANAFDRNIPDAEPIDIFHLKPRRGECCIIFAVNGVYTSYIYFDLYWTAHVIETVIPQISNYVFNTIKSMEI